MKSKIASRKTHSADATATYIAYTFQGQYALILLLDATDGEAVSVETQDDVVLEGNIASLYQLKHSLNTPEDSPRLTVANTGFWKTIFIWAKSADIYSQKFIYVTTAAIAPNSSLQLLRKSDSGRMQVVEDLKKEAERVVNAVQVAQDAGAKSLPHKERLSGCQAYLKLTHEQRTELVNRITIHPESFNALRVEDQVETRLTMVPLKIRKQIAKRLIEWGDRRVSLALLGKHPRLISKKELLDIVNELIVDHYDMSLPDDYSRKRPDPEEVAEDGMMEQQIQLVQGGDSRIKRAKLARWRAMSQRTRWIEDDFSLAATLADFDEQLVDEWNDLFGPICDDFKDETEAVLCNKGRNLLDWSHNEAPHQIPPIAENWVQPFLVRGSYQELANELKVGWHPNFEKYLSDEE